MNNGIDDRRQLVRESRTNPNLTPTNGIDFLEIDPSNEQTLIVHFLFDVDVVGSPLDASNFLIAGGERITSIGVLSIARDPTHGEQVAVNVNKVGDFSIYTLQLIPTPTFPLNGFDPQLSSVDFIFHVECAKNFDCKPAMVCPPEVVSSPPIDYLVKDYPGFVRVMLDRLSLLCPNWRERNPADLGVAVVEVLAYVADQLSYEHDVVDTEAYLGTCRLRTSARRHARLVDYRISDGSNARAWLHVELAGDLPNGIPQGTRCCTVFPNAQPPVLPHTFEAYTAAIDGNAEFFEIMTDQPLYANNSRMPLYAWSALEMCLPAGTTTATLAGTYALKRGDFVILAEVLGPRTGLAADADPAKRFVVRLVKDATHDHDPLYGTSQPITTITWHADDALPTPLCVASITDAAHGSQPIAGVSFALGNVVLADHGRRLGDPVESFEESLGTVPAVGRYRPQLAESPLTFAASSPYVNDNPADPAQTIHSALFAGEWMPSDTVPVLTLSDTDAEGNKQPDWSAVGDLLQIDVTGQTRAFVVEVENDGTAYLRFGDGVNGAQPDPGTVFTANYRVGNGTRGNVAADSILFIDTNFPGGGLINSLTNPLPAFGGVDPETIDHIRQNAPVAFRRQERAVTPDDYRDRAMQYAGVHRAAVALRWTGSWTTVFLTVERTGDVADDPAFKDDLKAYLEMYRMAGHDLEVEDAVHVPLLVSMHVCVEPGYVRSQVEQVLTQIFSDQVLPDGTLGVFHPDNLDLGQSFYLSPLYEAAQRIDGVQSVRIDTFARENAPSGEGLTTGVLTPGPFEIFVLQNDPNFPERGRFELTLDGGL